MEISKTTDYTLFRRMKGNRELNMKHVENLVMQMQKGFVQSSAVISVNNKYEIIDGQHRFQALKILQKPIYYIKDKGHNYKAVIATNNSQRKWQNCDYLNTYIKQDNIQRYKPYHKLKEFIDNNQISLKQTLMIGSSLIDNRYFLRDIYKKGNLTMHHVHLIWNAYNHFKIFLEEPFNLKIRTALLIYCVHKKGISFDNKKYKMNVIMHKLEKNQIHDLRVAHSKSDMLSSFERCLNMNQPTGHKYNLFDLMETKRP